MSVALGLSIPETIAVLNSSAQMGGHLLEEGTLHCALICSLVATRGLKDDIIKTSIVSKVVKQYIARGREYKEDKSKVYAQFAHGGVPEELAYTKLVELFDTTQAFKVSHRQMAQSIGQSV